MSPETAPRRGTASRACASRAGIRAGQCAYPERRHDIRRFWRRACSAFRSGHRRRPEISILRISEKKRVGFWKIFGIFRAKDGPFHLPRNARLCVPVHHVNAVSQHEASIAVSQNESTTRPPTRAFFSQKLKTTTLPTKVLFAPLPSPPLRVVASRPSPSPPRWTRFHAISPRYVS